MTDLGSVIEGGYLQDILDQPAALTRSVAGFTESRELAAIGERLRGGHFRQVLLTGMGSSYHALQPLVIELVESGVRATLIETSELIHYQSRLLSPESVTVVLSQSGRSAETVRLLELNAGRSCLVAVTNEPDSPLAAAAVASILTNAGPEFSVSSKTYLASLAALAWLSDQLAGRDPRESHEELAGLAPAVAGYLAHWRDFAAEAQRELGGIERLFYVGRGPSLAAAGTGGLITKESARFAAEGMSAAAFRHGPLELVDARTFLLVFEGDPRTARLNRRLALDVKSAGGKAAVVREDPRPALFHTPPTPPRLRPAMEILPVQMFTLALAALAGREAGAFALASKVTLAE
jgi:glucosamine--fructose-6-phosphate aminotransferase (isomerizing)